MSISLLFQARELASQIEWVFKRFLRVRPEVRDDFVEILSSNARSVVPRVMRQLERYCPKLLEQTPTLEVIGCGTCARTLSPGGWLALASELYMAIEVLPPKRLFPAEWYEDQTRGGITPDRLRMARNRKRLAGRKIGGRWYYAIDAVCEYAPEFEPCLVTAVGEQSFLAALLLQNPKRTEPNDRA